MKLTLGFSPCPNDTFIFDALVNKKIDTEGLEFEVHLEDVQTLNEWAIAGKLDISKISYGVLPLVLNNYVLLNSGGALGKGVGPLLISNEDPGEHQTPVEDCMIAIPGNNTTAHFLFSLAYPKAKNKTFLRFDEIEEYVLSNGKSKLFKVLQEGDLGGPSPPGGEGQSLPSKASAMQGVMGVIIHENRFTYQDKGLHKVVDLGDYWEHSTGNPIPLGGIVMKPGSGITSTVDRLIKKSIEYAFERYPEISDYTKAHSQEMSENVMRKHIDLYVNNYSLDLGKSGRSAVEKLMEVYAQVNPDFAMPKQGLWQG